MTKQNRLILPALITTLITTTFFAAPTAVAEECSGSTEVLLQCHSAEVKDFLKVWVRAWGDGDIETYLSLYTSARSPTDGMSRTAWVSDRRNRITPGKDIEINLKLESMGLEDSGIFDVIFEQQYRSDNYRDKVRKRLFLLREGGQLKIWKEETLE